MPHSTEAATATETIGVVVVQRRRIVGERYRPGFGPYTPYRTWSVAKSFTGALVGILVGDGRLVRDAPAPIPEWQSAGDACGRITPADLLHMSSGLEARGAAAEAVYFGGADSISEITSARLEAEPGTRYTAYWSFPRRALFDRIGMRHTVAETGWRGNFVLSSQCSPRRAIWRASACSSCRTAFGTASGSCRKVGSRNGRTPAPARSRGLAGVFRHGALGLLGYGAQLWLFQRSWILPFDGFGALGSRGQLVLVVPEHELVVVRTGLDSEPDQVFFRADRFVADVIEALR